MRTLRLSLAVVLLAVASSVAAQETRREIAFPDLPGYTTLKCDLHQHSVFSDGAVWPTVRVNEAWRQGLDALALTDHLEYQPHKADVPTKHDRPYELAAGRARERNLLLPKGSEITRDTPPGHFNALFLKDCAELDTPDFLEVFKRAAAQGAFVFWNHQGWKGSANGQWLPVHTTLYENKWIQGMEVANGDEYYPDAHAWCLEKKLAMLGNSDIHDPDLRKTSEPGDHRTMTLAFAKDRSLAGLKEALLEGRTAVWYKDQVIGRKEILEPLFAAAVRVAPPHLRSKDAVWVEMRNLCDCDLRLVRAGKLGPQEIVLPARTTSIVKIAAPKPAAGIELPYTVSNFLIAPYTGLPVTLTVAAEGPQP